MYISGYISIEFLTQAENMTEPEVQEMISEFVAMTIPGISAQA